MNKKIWLMLIALIVIIPVSANAFSFWWQKTAAPAKAAELSVEGKAWADLKYAAWQKSFDKEDVGLVIANQSKFNFSEAELNYLFNSESAKAKNPLATDFVLTIDEDILKVSANFKKVVKGPIYFEARLKSADKRARFEILKVKYYGFPLPAAWGNDIINKEADKYFSFLYKDQRYAGLDIKVGAKSVSIIPQFK